MLNRGLGILTLILAGLLFAANMAHAAPGTPAIAQSPCDTEYFKSLESRAWLEAQREITQNQNLIYKPDSVLAYTCFDKFANVLANMQEWNGFSENNRWQNVINPLTTAVDEALKGLVGPSLVSYLSSNFSNPYLGGRGGESYGGASRPVGTISGGAYACSEMNNVWQSAKCYNFQAIPNQDGFFTFEEHRAGEKRLLPTACVMTPEFQTTWSNQIRQAGLNPTTAPSNWPFDKVKVYYDKLDPAQCGSAVAIPTGITVSPKNLDINGGEPYPEHICIMPGCYYDFEKCAPSGGGGGAPP